MTGRIPNLARALVLGSLFATVIAGQSAFADGPVVSVRSPGSADAAAPRPAATRVGSRVDLTGARQALAAPVATYAPGAIDLALSTVVGGLSSPLFVTNAGDGSGRLFVVEKAGKIKIVSGGVVTGTFLDIRAKVSKDGERGLLGLAFHPDYPTTGTFYVYYTDLKRQDRPGRLPPVDRRSRQGRPGRQRPAPDQQAVLEPQRRHARVRARRLPVHGHRRRRIGRRPGQPRPEPEVAPREAAPDRHQRADRGSAVQDPELEPVRRQGRLRPDLGARPPQPVAVLVRLASPATCGSAMSARTAGRRSTGPRRPAAAVGPRTTGGG